MNKARGNDRIPAEHFKSYKTLLLRCCIQYSLVAQMVKSLTTMQETWVRSLGWEDILEEGMATHSSTLAWRIPGMGSLVGCPLWGCTESDMTEVT